MTALSICDSNNRSFSFAPANDPVQFKLLVGIVRTCSKE